MNSTCLSEVSVTACMCMPRYISTSILAFKITSHNISNVKMHIFVDCPRPFGPWRTATAWDVRLREPWFDSDLCVGVPVMGDALNCSCFPQLSYPRLQLSSPFFGRGNRGESVSLPLCAMQAEVSLFDFFFHIWNSFCDAGNCTMQIPPPTHATHALHIIQTLLLCDGRWLQSLSWPIDQVKRQTLVPNVKSQFQTRKCSSKREIAR
mgnify:CR=1 FL=1